MKERDRQAGESSDAASDAGRAASRRRWTFRVLAALLPVVLLAVVEAIRRVAGWGGYPPVVIPVGAEGGGTLCITNRTAPAVYFKGPVSGAGAMREFAFIHRKPPGTLRIVLAGGSAMEGFPQPAGLSAGAFLEEMLRAVLPYSPDWVILYSGHNEFFGAAGVASVHSAGRSPAAIRMRHTLNGLALVQAVSELGGDERPASPHLMERAAARRQIAPDDPIREQAARHLEAQARRLAEECKAAGAGLIICTLASHERGLAPIGRWASADPDVQTRVDQLLEEAAHAEPGVLRRSMSARIAAQLVAEGRAQDAVTLWRLAAASDPPLSVWHFEDVYGLLRARRTLQRGLTAEEAALARRTMGRIRLLAAHRPPPAGVSELWIGRFHVLIGEFNEALGTLLKARSVLRHFELVQADEAYVEACVNLGRLDEAQRIVAEGVARGGAWAAYYERMRASLPTP